MTTSTNDWYTECAICNAPLPERSRELKLDYCPTCTSHESAHLYHQVKPYAGCVFCDPANEA